MKAKEKRDEIRKDGLQKFNPEKARKIKAMFHNTINAQDRLDELYKYKDKTSMEEDLRCFATISAEQCDKPGFPCCLTRMCSITYNDIEKTKSLIVIEKQLLGREERQTNLSESQELLEREEKQTSLSESQEKINKILKTEKVWTKEEILANIQTKENWACNALIAVFKNQTSDEQLGHYTKHTNSKGFTKFDAELLTSFAHQYISKNWLSKRQLEIVRKRIPRYWRQLLALANKEEIK